MLRSFFDAFDFLVQAQGDATVAQVITKRLHHLGVRELQQARALLDQRNAHAQSGEHAHILDADDAAAHDNHGLGNLWHAQNLVAIDDGLVVERDQGRNGGLRTCRNDDVGGFKLGLSARTGDLHVVRIQKAGGSRHDFDAVAGQLRANHIDLRLDDVEGPEGKIGHGDRVFHAIIDAVDALILISGKMKDGFADGLAGDCASVDGGSADHFQLFNKRGSLSELRRLNRGPLASRSRTNHDEIVFLHGSRREYTTVAIAESLLTRA